MKGHKVTKGPSIKQIIRAIENEKPLNFTVDYGWGIGEDQMIPRRIEKVIDKRGNYYNISAIVVAENNPPCRQHFIYQPRYGNWGRWVGTFRLDHKAYEGHST